MVAFLLACAASIVAFLTHQTFLGLLLLGVTVCLGIGANDRVELAIPWIKGYNAEAAVGTELNELREEGYRVMHDVMFGGEGNLDHLVFGQNGAFLVETKFRRYELHELTKLKRQAVHLSKALGGHWVTPVMCAGVRKEPFRHNKVWIVGRGQVADLLRGLKGKPVDPDALNRFVDGLN